MAVPTLADWTASLSALQAELTTALSVLTARLPGPGVTQQQLRDRSWWSGPDIHIVVDDYDLVVGAVDGLADHFDFVLGGESGLADEDA